MSISTLTISWAGTRKAEDGEIADLYAIVQVVQPV